MLSGKLLFKLYINDCLVFVLFIVTGHSFVMLSGKQVS